MRNKPIIVALAVVLASGISAMVIPQRLLFDAEKREGDQRPKPDLTPARNDPSPSLSPLRREAQKSPGWQPNGIAVCDTAPSGLPKIVTDGNSGAIICWTECHRDQVTFDTDIYAQRVDSGGNMVWPSQGVPVCSLKGVYSEYPAMISDGKGGAIIAWEDSRGGLGYTRVFAQRLDNLGNRLWPENGVLVCNQMSGYVDLCSDGHGGVIIAYLDGRDIPTTSDNIYAQRMDSLGNPAWQIDGVPVCTADSIQFWPHICATQNNNALITWGEDLRNGNYDGYAQLIDYSGNIKWDVNGKPIAVKPGMQKVISSIYNYYGGGITSWQDYEDNKTYFRSIDSLGNDLWDPSGIAATISGKLYSDNRGGG